MESARNAPTLYARLGVTRTASQEAIRSAWTRLSAQWDPSRPHNTGAEARAQYKAIESAYMTLSDPHKRTIYDRRLQSAGSTGDTNKTALMYCVGVAIFAALVSAFSYVPSLRERDVKPVSQVEIVQSSAAPERVNVAQQSDLETAAEPPHARPEHRSEPLKLKLDTRI